MFTEDIPRKAADVLKLEKRVVPFLKNCRVEECERSSGICKLTGHRFKKGETRFVCSTGDKKVYLTIPAAAEVIQPVIDAEAEHFSANQIEGLDSISEQDRQEFEQHFRVSEDGLPKRRSPPKEEPKDAKGEPKSGKRKAAGKGGKSAVKRRKTEEDEEAEEEAEVEAEMEAAEGSDEGSAAESQESDNEEDEPPASTKKSSPPETPSKSLPEYERQRLAIIARNKERMKQLGLEKLAAEIMPKAQPKPRTQQKGLAARRKAQQHTGPRRASLRQQGIQADNKMIDQELRNGQVVLGGNSALWEETPTTPKEPEPPKERHPKDALPFESENGGEGVDEKYLNILKKSVAPPTSKSKGEKGRVNLQKLKLKEQDVAKVTGNGISHIQWHPTKDNMILAAADKSGNLGLWHVNHDPLNEEDDGVLAFKPHHSYVSGLRWVSGGGAACKLYTASYDGSLRCLDPATGRFELTVTSEDAEFSAFDCTPDGNVAIMGDNDGYLHVYDIRENAGSARSKEVEIHNKRVNTLHFAPGEEHVFVSSSGDNSLAVWDLRKFGGYGRYSSIAKAVHPKTCQSAYFAPDGSKRIVSLSRDDTVKIWQFDGKSGLEEMRSIHHNNNTGRWILPFRATWSPAGDSIVVGNMRRQVDIFSAKNGELQGGLQSEYMTAISSRAAVHPDLNLLAASTASGRVHVYRS